MVYPVSHSEEAVLLYNLKKRGFSLLGIRYEPRPILPIDELLIRAVRDYKEPRVTEGLALIIDNDPPNYQKLVQSALEHHVQNEIGYVLEGTLQVLKTHKPQGDYAELEWAIKALYSRKSPEIKFLTRIGMPHEEEMLSRNPAPEDIRWNIRGGVTFKQFDTQYRVYHGIQHPQRPSRTAQTHR